MRDPTGSLLGRRRVAIEVAAVYSHQLLRDVLLQVVEQPGAHVVVAHATKRRDAGFVQEVIEGVTAEQRVLIFSGELIPELLEQNCSFIVSVFPEDIDHLTESADEQVLALLEKQLENAADCRHK